LDPGWQMNECEARAKYVGVFNAFSTKTDSVWAGFIIGCEQLLSLPKGKDIWKNSRNLSTFET